jgi:hypothetical protein
MTQIFFSSESNKWLSNKNKLYVIVCINVYSLFKLNSCETLFLRNYERKKPVNMTTACMRHKKTFDKQWVNTAERRLLTGIHQKIKFCKVNRNEREHHLKQFVLILLVFSKMYVGSLIVEREFFIGILIVKIQNGRSSQSSCIEKLNRFSLKRKGILFYYILHWLHRLLLAIVSSFSRTWLAKKLMIEMFDCKNLVEYSRLHNINTYKYEKWIF